MVAHIPDWRGTRDESVLIVMATRAIEIREKAELGRVALGEKILPKNIRDQHLLIARIKLVQVRVGIFLEHLEGGEIVLPAIVVVIAKDAGAEIGVVKDETAKIAHERLDAGTRRNEIVIVREIADVYLGKCFLERGPIFVAPRILEPRIGIEHAGFLHVGVVAVVNAEKTYGPFHGFESGFAFEQIDAEREIV